MKNINYKIFALGLLALIAGVSQASASEITGTMSTGLGNAGVSAVVVSAPQASVAPGAYTTLQYVALTAEGSTQIRWTVDGTAPDCATVGTKYNVEIPIGVSSTLKAISCYPNNKFSDVASFVYVINPPATVTPPPGSSGGGGGGSITTAPKAGDITLDGQVNIFDFALLMSNWGVAGSSTSDLNNDSKVDILDFALLMANWGK